jgi:peptide/nickel transport system permease protein
MRTYVIRRIAQNAFILWALVTIMFVLFRLVPGNPVEILLSNELSDEARAVVLRDWGLDKPLAEQYAAYLFNLLTGNFGISFYHQVPVSEILWEKMTNTLVLMLPAKVLGVIIGVAAGMYLGWHRNSRFERIGVLLPPIIRAMPVFWLGVLLLMLFSYELRLFPNAGMRSVGTPVGGGFIETFVSIDFLWHLTLPLTCMVITSLPEPLLIMRSSLLETRGEDFLEILQAKGLSEGQVLRHAARNSMLPVVTWSFHMIGYAVAGAVVIEVVFAWPGIGRELVNAVDTHDYPLAQGAFFLISSTIIAVNFLLDLVYGLLDPRVVLE